MSATLTIDDEPRSASDQQKDAFKRTMFKRTMDEMAATANGNGMTQETLNDILDENDPES